MQYEYSRETDEGIELEFLAVGTSWEPYCRQTWDHPTEGGYFNDVNITLEKVDGRLPTAAEVALYLPEEEKRVEEIQHELALLERDHDNAAREAYNEAKWEARHER